MAAQPIDRQKSKHKLAVLNHPIESRKQQHRREETAHARMLWQQLLNLHRADWRRNHGY